MTEAIRREQFILDADRRPDERLNGLKSKIIDLVINHNASQETLKSIRLPRKHLFARSTFSGTSAHQIYYALDIVNQLTPDSYKCRATQCRRLIADESIRH